MLIYLAARYSRLREMQECRKDLENLGHKVTSRWIDGNHQIDDAGLSASANEAERIRFAEEDRDDLMAADCVISFTEQPRSSNTRGGRHVEFGIALALMKRVVVVGHRENVFHCLPVVEFFQRWSQVIATLARQKTPEPETREPARRFQFYLGDPIDMSD